MRLSRVPLGLGVAGLVLGATAAAAAPVATTPTTPTTPSGNKPQIQCPTPDKNKCVEKGYLDGACGQKHLSVCQPFVIDAMKAHAEAQASPKVKMLRPKTTEMPQNVVTGNYFAYKKLAATKTTVEKVYRKSNDALAGISGMDMSKTPPVNRVTKVDPNQAALFHRNPAWRDNGMGVRSCKEYAYARSYGGTRFIDASSACKGDRECVFSVAYMNAPTGIAGHKLFDEAGVAMSRQLELPVGKKPKNDMFAPGLQEFVKAPTTTFPNGVSVQNVEIAALRSALRTGAEYYEIGVCKGAACDGTRRFADVWDWHKHLHGVTASLSQAEAEEYERRRARFRALLEQWSAAVNRERAMGKGMLQERPLVLPFDMRAYDPFERFEFEREYIEFGRDTQTKFKQRFGGDIATVPREQAIQKIQQKLQQQGIWSPGSGSLALGVLAAPSVGKAKPTPWAAVGSADVDPAPWLGDGTVSRCDATTDWGLEMFYAGPTSCRISEFLITEWRRKAAGQKSCLDLQNAECDWNLEMFEAGVLSQVQELDVQVSDEDYCNAYREPKTFVDDPQNGGVSTVTVVKTRLDATRARVEKELKAVSQYLRPRNNVGQRLGKDWEGGDLVGDKSWFAAGYEYGVGWDVSPVEKLEGTVCQIAGTAHGEMAFDAWIIGGKIPVVDGAVRAEAKPNNGGSARFNAHLEMMGQSVFNTHGWKVAQTFKPSDDSGWGVQVPSGLKPRFDIYVGVPISGQLWGELLFGSTLALSGRASDGCEPNNPKLSIGAEYQPFFGAFGLGQVGVGIAGVASAGIRASLTLVMLGLPADISMTTGIKDARPTLSFTSELSLSLATLSGRVSLYVEFLMFDEEFELFRWKGFHTKVPLMPKFNASVSIVGLN